MGERQLGRREAVELTSPQVSILIPVYNREGLIAPCIASALAQSFRDLEVIVVDNASSDATWEICRRYAARDARVRVFRNEANLGPVRNWQRCVELARGDFSKLLFSDDLIDPNHVSALMGLMSDPRVGFAFSAVRTGAADGPRASARYRIQSLRGVQPSSRFLLEALVQGNTPMSPGAALFRTADLRSAIMTEVPSPTLTGFADTGAGVDLLIYLLIAARHPCVAHDPVPSAFFREHAQSISTEKRELVHAQVNQARIWFCSIYRSASFYRAMLTLAWFIELRRTRRLVSSRQVVARYADETGPLRAPDVLQAVWSLGALFIHKIAGLCLGLMTSLRATR